MHWDDMRIFLSVARAEGLSRAADRVRMDPATLGRRIARLETDLGAALFSKGPAGYRLTAAGARLMDHAERAERAMLGAEAEVKGALTGALRIGAPDGCATFLLPQVCASLVRDHPGLEIEIVALPRIFDLGRREADMAIAVSRPVAGRLTVQKIADYRLSLAAHRDYLAAAPRLDGLDDLARHRIVGYVPDMIFDRELDYLGEIGVETAHLASSSVAVQAQWIAQGAGVGIVHDFTLPRSPGVVRVLPDKVRLTRAFWLVRHAEDARSARHDALAAALVERLAREIARAESA
ncbi:LysR family transcriptional regulator [Palleronia sediminis]|uniref:LysR family transcriptional regulator n=1 Tax=Palleronia sediminis TaxID=2547833 RepID=A0A4R6A9V0_9RHOB|nr:LysR family transcriptional regulator [Palleronia sediminis]TDL79474.1 LysR family transcriptional regulator [Palleronia sediminis]